MIISTSEELRLFSPSNAIDDVESLIGFISSSENDFLKEKLGDDLYGALLEYYHSTIRDDVGEYIAQMQIGRDIPAYAKLLYLAQKAVTFDALSRAISVQAVSINGSGVNVASAEDYKAADAQSISDFKKACVKEAHSAINEMLQSLENWAKVDENNSNPSDETEEQEIVRLWKNSRYYYLVSSLLIPSATILQEYYNIYESREKFIQLLPEIRYIQEDIIAPIYGDDFIEYISSRQFVDCSDKYVTRITHNLRKIMARYLETRLSNTPEKRCEAAYNEAIKLTSRLNDYLEVNQEEFTEDLLDVFKTTSLYVDPDSQPCVVPRFKNNADDSVIFVTPGLI